MKIHTGQQSHKLSEEHTFRNSLIMMNQIDIKCEFTEEEIINYGEIKKEIVDETNITDLGLRKVKKDKKNISYLMNDDDDTDPLGNSSDDDPKYVPNTDQDKYKKRKSIVNCFTQASQVQNCIVNEVDAISSVFTSSEQSVEVDFHYAILNGKYFKITSNDQYIIEAQCQICLPANKTIRGSKGATTNFLKHLRRKHMPEYETYLKEKSENLSRKRKISSSNKQSKSTKLGECSGSSKFPNQKEFDSRILNFIINTISPISVIENKSFINLFQGSNLSVMSRKTAIKRLDDLYVEHINDTKKRISHQEFVCTTADIWSTKNRSFLGVTCHWINPDYSRTSVALSCERFEGTNDHENIALKLKTLYDKYFINTEKIVATVTDNASNFIKAFEIFSINEIQEGNEEASNFEEDPDTEDIEFIEIPDHLEKDSLESNINDNNSNIILPQHKRCASHSINLIVTTDIKNVIESNVSLRNKHMNSITKCKALWRKANQPKTVEIIKSHLGHTLSAPGVTRWNSLYESINQIISEKKKVPNLFQKLGLQSFTDNEFLYLEEYCEITKPLAETLDFLQTETNIFYGSLLPSIISLKNKLNKLKAKTFKCGGDILLNSAIEGIQKRFEKLLTLHDRHAVLGAISHPEFKLRWFPIVETNTPLSKEDLKKLLITECELFELDFQDLEAVSFPTQTDISKDDFFDFSESETSFVENTNRVQLEVLQYLNDLRKNITMLDSYPLVKKVFFKYNTILPSSGPVERLFSFATMERRNALPGTNFEKLVILKSNNINIL